MNHAFSACPKGAGATALGVGCDVLSASCEPCRDTPSRNSASRKICAQLRGYPYQGSKLDDLARCVAGTPRGVYGNPFYCSWSKGAPASNYLARADEGDRMSAPGKLVRSSRCKPASGIASRRVAQLCEACFRNGSSPIGQAKALSSYAQGVSRIGATSASCWLALLHGLSLPWARAGDGPSAYGLCVPTATYACAKLVRSSQ
jgi:hypothetical protein